MRTHIRTSIGRLPLMVLASVGALLAAVVVQVVAVLGGQPWDGVEFAQDIVQNAFIAVLLAAAATALQRHQDAMARRRDQSRYILGFTYAIEIAVGGWRVPQPVDDSPRRPLSIEDVRTLERGAQQMTSWAAKLDNWLHDADTSNDLLLKLWDIHTMLMEYLEEGSRGRRQMCAAQLVNDLGPMAAGADSDLVAAARSFRRSAMDWATWTQHTDTVIVERLLVEREIAVVPGTSPAAGWLFDAYEGTHIPAAAMSHDMVYVLLFHLDKILPRHESDLNSETSGSIVRHVRRPLGALRNELLAGAACSRDLARLADLAVTGAS